MNDKYKPCIICNKVLVCIFKVEFNFLPVCKICEKEINKRIKGGY